MVVREPLPTTADHLFYLLASEGTTHFDRDQLWHLGTLAVLAEQRGYGVGRNGYTESVEPWFDALQTGA